MSIQTQSKKLPILGAVLGVQLVIAGLLIWQSEDPVTAINEPLIVFEPAAVDRVVIEGNTEEVVDVRKDGEQWTMGDKLPVLESKVQSVLDTLAGLRTQWPVANSAAAAERFGVADDGYLSKVTLYQDDNSVGSILIGSTPSFNKTHVRRPGEPDIYALRFSAYDATAERDNWLDTTLLQPEGEIISITSNDYAVEKVDGQWPASEEAEEVGAEDVANQEAQQPERQETLANANPPVENNAEAQDEDALTFDAGTFADTLEGLRVVGIAEDNAALDALETDGSPSDQALSVIHWTVKTSSGEYEYKMLAKEDKFFLQRNDYAQTFRISKYQYDNFATIKKKSLSVAKQ